MKYRNKERGSGGGGGSGGGRRRAELKRETNSLTPKPSVANFSSRSSRATLSRHSFIYQKDLRFDIVICGRETLELFRLVFSRLRLRLRAGPRIGAGKDQEIQLEMELFMRFSCLIFVYFIFSLSVLPTAGSAAVQLRLGVDIAQLDAVLAPARGRFSISSRTRFSARE